MKGKFMNVRRIVVSVITLALMTSQILGCSVVASADMVKMINSGQNVSIEVAVPKEEQAIVGQQEQTLPWIQLDQLKTYSTFRNDADKLLNVNTVTEVTINGKSGSLYVDSTGDRVGNSTLVNAFRNKTFVEKYWNNNDVKGGLAKLGSEAYSDLGTDSQEALMATLNAYFNLLPDSKDGDKANFNGKSLLTRELFYTLVYRASTPVQTVTQDQSFTSAIGGKTDLSNYAQGVDKNGFLSVNNKSLDQASYSGVISRGEAVYLVANTFFKDALNNVNGKEKAYADTENAGDLALKAGFKDKDNSTKTISEKERWQSYTLAYMLKNPSNGMQDEMYKAMVVSSKLGLLGDVSESRWDEGLTKADGLELMVKVAEALNAQNGYLSNAEYGKTVASKFTIAMETPKTIQATEAETESNPDKKLSSGYTLSEARDKIEALIGAIEKMGDKAENNMDLINNQCDVLGTTYKEIQNLPAKVTQQPVAPQAQTVAPQAQTVAPQTNTQVNTQSQVTQSAPQQTQTNKPTQAPTQTAKPQQSTQAPTQSPVSQDSQPSAGGSGGGFFSQTNAHPDSSSFDAETQQNVADNN